MFYLPFYHLSSRPAGNRIAGRREPATPPHSLRAWLTLTLFIVLLPAFADNISVGPLTYQLSATGNTASVVGFSSELATGTQLTVPATISSGGATYTITELADNCLNATDNGCPLLSSSLTADEVKAMFGTDVKLAEYTGSTHSTVSADGYDLNFQRTASITAGKPVLICGAAEPGDNTYLCGKMALGTYTQYGTKVESNVSQTDPSADADNHFNLQGTYIHNSSFILSGDYYLGTGNKLHHAKSGKALGSARMVVRYQGTNAQAKLMGLDFDGITTAIDEIKLDEATRTTLHASSKGKEPRYNLTGQRVGANYKGVVIVNGKKMLNL